MQIIFYRSHDHPGAHIVMGEALYGLGELFLEAKLLFNSKFSFVCM